MEKYDNSTKLPILSIRGLEKSFGSLKVLRGIDLDVYQGEIITILGPSGTGKSTLLRCINYLEKPDKGEIHLENLHIRGEQKEARGIYRFRQQRQGKKEIHQLRQKSGMIFQQFHLFSNKTVLENVMLPMRSHQKMTREEARQKSLALLELVGMEAAIHQYPETLSGGQQQRVAIARSLGVAPKILLLDEPTSALDPEWIGEVLAVIKKLASQNYTMMIVTHEIEFAREVSDRIIFMEGGYIVEQGSAKDILENPRHERLQQFLGEKVSSLRKES